MPMNINVIPTLDDRVNQIRFNTAKIVNQEILPNESKLWAARAGGQSDADKREVRELRRHIQDTVKKAGLWAPHLPEEYGGMGSGNRQAPLVQQGAPFEV